MKRTNFGASGRFAPLLAVAAVLLSMFAVAPSLLGQASDGNVTGAVTDPSGAPIPDATVTLANMDTGIAKTLSTDASGVFLFPNVLAGRYQLHVTGKGFVPQTLKSLTVELNKTLTANVRLQLGEVSTTVEVTEAAVAVDTSSAQIASSFESRQALDLSMSSNANSFNNLGAINLSLLSAGVASSGGVGYGVGPSVGGQRPTNNNFVIEGIDNNRRDITGPVATISNEATGNFTLIQNMMEPEFGHSSGGTFNVTPRSGTNAIHGSLYEYMENRNLNALDAAYKRSGISDRPRFDQNRLGATIGGPIVRNKLFYFGNFEYRAFGQAATSSSQVQGPTAEGVDMINSMPGISQTNWGIFKQYVPVAPTASDTIAVGGRQIPIGNLPILAPFYINDYNWVGSVDYNIDDKDSLRFRVIGNNQRSIDNVATLPVFFQNSPSNSYVVAASYFRNFSPTLLNEFRAAYTRYLNDTPSGNYTFPGLNAFPNLQITNELGLQIGPDTNAPQSTSINTYTLVDNVTKILGRHTLKMGVDGRRVIAPQFFVQRVRGDYEYTTLQRYLFDLQPDDLGERSFGASAYWGNLWSAYTYFNDDFKLLPNLTLNLGIRYEYVGVPAGSQTQSMNAEASVPGLITFQKPTAQWNNWAPRVGFAWSPGKGGDLSIRGGFGIAYDQSYQNLGILSLPPQFFTTSNVDLTTDTPGFLANGGLQDPGGGTSLSPADARALTSSYVPNQKRPYAINWSIGVQKSFHNDYTVEVRYLGNRGVNLPAQVRLNAATVVTPANSLPTYLTRPDRATLDSLHLTLDQLNAQSIYAPDGNVGNFWAASGFQQFITAFMPIGNSSYEGMALQVSKRFSKGVSFVGSYTWSHLIDDGTATVNTTSISPRRPEDSQNYRTERASSALDRRQRFSFSGIYEAPWFKGSPNWFVKNLLGNYTFTGTYIAESPMYGTVQSAIDSNLNGDTAGDRAIINPAGRAGTGSDVTPLLNSSGETVAYLANDPTARYIRAGIGAYANGGRNLLPLRGINNFDITVMKNFQVREQQMVQFRAEFYNFFNHSQYTPGATDNAYFTTRTSTRNYLIPGNPSFNQPDTAFENNARVIQLVLRYQF